MNGRKAKARRKAETPPTVPDTVHGDGTSGTVGGQHPLGSWAGATMEWRRRQEEAMKIIIAENIKALGKCTNNLDCPASLHHPHCSVAR